MSGGTGKSRFRVLDCINDVGSLDPSRLWLLTTKAREEGAEHDDRSRLSPSFQQIAFLVEETGEYNERRLNHSDGEAEKFYRDLQLQGACVRVGMEATGYSRWFERLLAELGFEVWIGDPAEIKTRRVKKQRPTAKTRNCC
jgi:hypothetical protein